jgi:hypothetical protein
MFTELPILRHRNIQHTVRYTELSPTRFKDFWPRISATLRKLDAVPIKSIVEAQIFPILVPPTTSPYF